MEHLYFCTLFNVKYLSRGIVLYNSLVECCSSFTLYVIAFDQKTESVLKSRNFKNMVVVGYDEFEDDILRQAKANRTFREFFWTCGCHSIKYVLHTYNVQHCTYIDADMYFYKDPTDLVRQMMNSGCSVGITPHNYPNYPEYKHIEKKCGKYCMEFNTFINDSVGNKVLNWWCDQCIQCCTEKADGVHFGDQKYLEQFEKLFSDIFVYDNPGVGVAPWNLTKYSYDEAENQIVYKDNNEKINLFFYHFHELSFNEEKANMKLNIRPGKIDGKLCRVLYEPYLNKLINEEKKIADIYCVEECKDKISINFRYVLDFLTNEPNFIFLIRKVFRYIFRGKLDIIFLKEANVYE